MDLITVLKTENITLFVDPIQLLVVAQIMIIFLVIGVLVFLRSYLIKKQKSALIRREQFSEQLACLNTGKIHLTPQLIRLYKKYIFDFTECLRTAQDSYPLPIDLRRKLAHHILIPKARQLAQSHRWINQSIAVACYQYAGNDIQDKVILIKLLQSKTFIVCIGAVRIIVQNPTKSTMQALISVLSSSRKLHQDLLLQILPTVEGVDKAKLTDYFVDRLETDHNIYVRCFCYRIAKKLVPAKRLIKLIKADILNKNIDLKIAALDYLSCIPNQKSIHLIENATDDTQFEVRAVAVKLLGECKALTAISTLESKLRDPSWWVRINAANALVTLGSRGIAILKKQRPDIDKFAYETSQKILLTLRLSHDSR